MPAWPVRQGVPAAGHVTGGGHWHPGAVQGCAKCKTTERRTMFKYDTKKDLRHDLRGRKIREVMVKGALADTREIELRMDGGITITVEATPFGTLQISTQLSR
jgi:hypothetical protein